MNTKQQSIVICFLAISMLVSGCGPGQLLGPTVTPTATATLTPTPTTARFEGTIYFSGEPFAGATVSLGDPSKVSDDPEHTITEVTTNAEGSYSLVVDPGAYTLGVILEFSESDYPCETESASIPMVWIPIEDTVETDATKLTDPWFGVWGTKSNQSGAPLKRVLIAASDSITVAGGDTVRSDMFAVCNQ